MSFETVLGQEQAIARLRAMIAHGRVPSALLFLGPHGVGKRTAALALARALNCAERPGEGCHREGSTACSSCRRIAEGLHPDVTVIGPEGQFVKIDQVRAIAEQLALIPFEAAKRVVIVHRAERMHPAAANAFLKTLEEPPADTLIVLTAPGPALLPETIVSRCMPLRFAPLAPATVRAILERELSGEELEFAVRHAQGRLRPELRRDARRLRALRDAVLGTLDELDRLDYGGIAEQAGAWTGGEDWAFVLECMETWYHDLALLAAGADEGRLINGDRRDALWRWCARLSPERATAGLRQVLASRDAMLLNVNKGLALESLCLALRALTHAQGEKPPWTAA